MKSLIIGIALFFSFNTYAASGCSLAMAKKIAKYIFELESENNGSEGKISFKRGSEKFGFETLEYTKPYLLNKINDILTGASRKEVFKGYLDAFESDERNRIYRVSQQKKSGSGKCGYGAVCTSAVHIVLAKQLDDNRCFVTNVGEES